ncbi:Sec-independent protein translocase protein TatB [Striga asiatica]|uniref:Sec-independent protein translocase protein TatB n=1 Tax=Striga asiatica TaxID=4170 RepID=A0A5A7QDQ8_STRAF|nr:Sec-independent protein translocase protein TatB [Striga asiatica]
MRAVTIAGRRTIRLQFRSGPDFDGLIGVVEETKGQFGVLRKLNHKFAEIILGTVLQLIIGSPTMLPAVDVQSWLRVGGAVAVKGEDEVTEKEKNDENEFTDEQKKDEQDDS